MTGNLEGMAEDSSQMTTGPHPPRPGLVGLTWVALIMVVAWVGLSRVLIGTAGALSVIYALTLVPVLAILGILTLTVPHLRGTRVPSRSLGWLGISLGCGLVLGFFLPDAPGSTSSVVGVMFGEAMAGAASAISNPMAVIMVFCAVMACVMAFLDSRPAGPRRTTDEDRYQGTGFFPLLETDNSDKSGHGPRPDSDA